MRELIITALTAGSMIPDLDQVLIIKSLATILSYIRKTSVTFLFPLLFFPPTFPGQVPLQNTKLHALTVHLFEHFTMLSMT